jgi:hypothetical protein
MVYLTGSGAGRVCSRRLGNPLGQAVRGPCPASHRQDTIKSDYPEEFKAEFKSVPLSE